MKAGGQPNEDPVLEAGIESFPASDPPAWTVTGFGAPAPNATTSDHGPPMRRDAAEAADVLGETARIPTSKRRA